MLAQFMPRGDTYQKGRSQSAITALPNNPDIEGLTRDVKNVDPTNKAVVRDSTRVILKMVRNVSTIALKPMRVVKYVAGSDVLIDGYLAEASGAPAGVVDEFLPSVGVRDDDWFWIVIRGQTRYNTQETNNAENTIALGDLLVGSGHGTTAGTTGGHLLPFTLDGKTASDTAMLNKVARALATNSASSTNVNILVNVNIWPG